MTRYEIIIKDYNNNIVGSIADDSKIITVKTFDTMIDTNAMLIHKDLGLNENIDLRLMFIHDNKTNRTIKEHYFI